MAAFLRIRHPGARGPRLTALPLLERKRILLEVLPTIDCRLLYLDHLVERDRDLFRAACERDLEGIVGKCAHGAYQTHGRTTSRVKIKNSDYSQIVGRHELYESRSHRRQPRPTKRPELRLA